MWHTAFDTLTIVVTWPGWQPLTTVARALSTLLTLGITTHHAVRVIRGRR